LPKKQIVMLQLTLLSMHIGAGFLALILGLIAIISKKGRKLHSKTGTGFVISMLVVSTTAIMLSLVKPNPFLFNIGIFTLYLIFAGVIAIKFYKSTKGYAPAWYHKLVTWMFLVFSIKMWVQPLLNMIKLNEFYISVGQIFGLIMFISSLSLLRRIYNKKYFTENKKLWLFEHIGNISGAYIATTTAFLVTNIQLELMWIVWLAPTVIGGIFISYAIRNWKLKLGFNTK
jgi:uncharacterized membrane protein